MTRIVESRMLRSLWLVSALCLAVTGTESKGSSQRSTKYYWHEGEKIQLIQSNQAMAVLLSADISKNPLPMTLSEGMAVRRRAVTGRNYVIINSTGTVPLGDRLRELSAMVQPTKVYPAYFVVGHEDHPVIPFDEIACRFRQDMTAEEIETTIESEQLVVLDRQPSGIYLLGVRESSRQSGLDAANKLQESGLTVWAAPNFFGELESHAIFDPDYGKQWYLNNTGQSGGTAGVDINAPEAWNITMGNPSIRVGLIDWGTGAHEDLSASKLIDGYTMATGGDGSPTTVAHGQATGGIIAANHNNSKGIRGIAPNVTITPVNIQAATAYDVAIAVYYADAVSAVISGSWGSAPYPMLTEAINLATTNGRGGLGTVVVFSAGNCASQMAYPASLPNVIKVGAVSHTNQRSLYSPQGTNPPVSLVAPSNPGSSACGGGCPVPPCDFFESNPALSGIYTLDLTGSPGYTTGNYTWFGGTSAAAPQVAAVAALVLSINPGLTRTQVTDIILNSATDLGDTNWAGAGRLNAYQAVLDASAAYPKAGLKGLREAVPDFRLSPNYPNPFNPSTRIPYSIPQNGHVSLAIYNVLGQKVSTLVDEFTPSGSHVVEWNAEGFTSGIYYARLLFGGSVNIQKLILTR